MPLCKIKNSHNNSYRDIHERCYFLIYVIGCNYNEKGDIVFKPFLINTNNKDITKDIFMNSKQLDLN